MHLLVIEDNPDLVANLYDFFEARGHTVDAAYDAFNGLKLAAEGRYDAIVLDLMLPGMDGLDVCVRLREGGSDTPILMLTARDTLENKLEGFASGTDDYLVKPFALTELEARLLALVRRGGGALAHGRLRVADLSFDPETLHVERGGRRIELPRISLKILEVLMRKSPRVVTRAELERVVWGDSPPDSDALRTHMHMLRSAIDAQADRPLLHTVRGIGYRLADRDAD
ncbi:MAG: response regulator transcription factor [Gammaproteobacteria bacterium]|nr:response regulator transcription factor [Gammaproteobacteria bacterium]NIR31775.1 response regulator transcription factor [Gammaproteobacteria bacterium]NIR98706.1 response regulator transcription factor [Gammaproteobacteria bacterium]NIT64423.1 response regulator transcription factor [Gammaproteobacteria bacterium]NIV20838.1 response regulator [Gammaproteobacteria bacterium]